MLTEKTLASEVTKLFVPSRNPNVSLVFSTHKTPYVRVSKDVKLSLVQYFIMSMFNKREIQ